MVAAAKLTQEQVTAVQGQIDRYTERLRRIPGFVRARPGFRLLGSRLIREPAIVVYVERKRQPLELRGDDVAPKQLGSFLIDVREISPQIEWQLAQLDQFLLRWRRPTRASMAIPSTRNSISNAPSSAMWAPIRAGSRCATSSRKPRALSMRPYMISRPITSHKRFSTSP